jgi:hypothetical protein
MMDNVKTSIADEPKNFGDSYYKRMCFDMLSTLKNIQGLIEVTIKRKDLDIAEFVLKYLKEVTETYQYLIY